MRRRSATSAEPSPPTVRRPTADDARRVAVWRFQHGERVDMNTVASQLGIGRTTLYRWVGDREKLMDYVILESVDDLWRQSLTAAAGDGIEYALDAVARFIRATTAYAPLARFVEREPNLALRVLLDPAGLVVTALTSGLAAAITAAAPELEVPPPTYGVLSVAATAVVWANVAGGREPDIDSTVAIMRTVLLAHERREP
ncbi:QsdR family transcriptional regulator [Nocardia sp. NPDC059764]|uniref:QsdR family transcriptional regulator n=1 Tax=Nocardia sp. NPDC059764 TaxID=3346939 RepID=UPI0036547EE4